MSNNNYVYEDPDSDEDMATLEAYWQGLDDGREAAGGGFDTLMGGMFIGASIVGIPWLLISVWS